MSSSPMLLPFVRGGCRLAREALSASITRARQATGMHLYRIDGYSLVDGTVRTGEAVRSSPFLVGGRSWELIYYPNGVNSKYSGFVSVDLGLGYGETVARATYRVSILDYAGNPMHSRVVGPRRFQRLGSEWTGVDELVATEELRKAAPFLIRNDCLNVQCDIAVLKMDTKPRNKWFMRLHRVINGSD